ncbi:MAG: AAA family ATPase [Oligoflexia bacterium]|nr:AAA family ATPase [Oligoflexia bacterium]
MRCGGSLGGKPGRIIVVEGLDGVGKTTLSLALARRLRGCWLTTPGAELRAVREQFDAAFADDPIARALAYAASVIAVGHRAAVLRDQGHDVVIDRYWLSTLVYAPRGARAVLAAVDAHIVTPDLTLFLSASRSVREARMGPRRALSQADQATLDVGEDRRLRRRYRALRAHPAAGTLVVVEASGSQAKVLSIMEAWLVRRGLTESRSENQGCANAEWSPGGSRRTSSGPSSVPSESCSLATSGETSPVLGDHPGSRLGPGRRGGSRLRSTLGTG